MRFLLPIMLLSTAATVHAQAPAPRPIEQFAKLDFMSQPRLSPNGTKIAARFAVKGEEVLAIIPVGGGGKPVFISLKDQDLRWYSWVNEEWLLGGVGESQVMYDHDMYITRSVSISADGKTVKPIAVLKAAQLADDLLWTAKDGSPRALIAMQTSFTDDVGFWPQVFEVNVATGKTKMVLGSHRGIMDWYADADGNVRMGIGYNGASKKIFVNYRNVGEDSFRTVDSASVAKSERLLVPQLFLDGNKAIAKVDSSGYEALYELDLGTMKIGKPVFETDGYDVGYALTDRSGKKLAGVAYTDTRTRVRWLDPDLAQLQTDIETAVGGRPATIISKSQDHSRVIVHVGGPDEPGGYYLFDRGAGQMQRIANVNQSLGTGRLAPVKTIKYKARDGLEMSAVLTTPAGREAKNLPLIMLPHGGPHVRDEEAWDWWAQFLADRGYAVLQPNYRGSTGYGTDFERKGLGEWGLKMQDDLVDAVEWAAKAGIADPKRVCIAGASYGGYAALRGAQRDGGVYRCAVSFAGVSDLEGIMRYDKKFLLGDWAKSYWKEQASDFKAVSPLHHASSFSMPTLIMHGKKDKRVPVKQSRQMAEKLKAAGKDFAYIEQPEGDHHFSREADRLQFLQELEKFLAKHNPA